MLPSLELAIKERLPCSYRLILFWNMSYSLELGLTLVFDPYMERTTVDNSEHDYPRWQTTAPKTWIVKNRWNRMETPSDYVYYPLYYYLHNSIQKYPNSQLAWRKPQNKSGQRTAHHMVGASLLSSHRAPRALFCFLSFQPPHNTKRPLRGESFIVVALWVACEEQTYLSV